MSDSQGVELRAVMQREYSYSVPELTIRLTLHKERI
jgi:hypothetical protein